MLVVQQGLRFRH
jgi:hypothetical protein